MWTFNCNCNIGSEDQWSVIAVVVFADFLVLFLLQVLTLEMFRITPFPLSEDVYIAKC